MEQDRIASAILSENDWIMSEFLHDNNAEKTIDNIRMVADEDEGLENLIFELGLAYLIRVCKGQQYFLNKVLGGAYEQQTFGII